MHPLRSTACLSLPPSSRTSHIVSFYPGPQSSFSLWADCHKVILPLGEGSTCEQLLCEAQAKFGCTDYAAEAVWFHASSVSPAWPNGLGLWHLKNSTLLAESSRKLLKEALSGLCHLSSELHACISHNINYEPTYLIISSANLPVLILRASQMSIFDVLLADCSGWLLEAEGGTAQTYHQLYGMIQLLSWT